MFNLDPNTLEVFKLALAYLAGGAAMIALIITAVIFYDVRQGRMIAASQRHTQDLNADRDAIAEALGLFDDNVSNFYRP